MPLRKEILLTFWNDTSEVMNPKFLFVTILDNMIRSTENRNPFLTMTEIHCSFYKESFGEAYLAKLCISEEEAF